MLVCDQPILPSNSSAFIHHSQHDLADPPDYRPAAMLALLLLPLALAETHNDKMNRRHKNRNLAPTAAPRAGGPVPDDTMSSYYAMQASQEAAQSSASSAATSAQTSATTATVSSASAAATTTTTAAASSATTTTTTQQTQETTTVSVYGIVIDRAE